MRTKSLTDKTLQALRLHYLSSETFAIKGLEIPETQQIHSQGGGFGQKGKHGKIVFHSVVTCCLFWVSWKDMKLTSWKNRIGNTVSL